jgi:hypothetical protein
LLLRAAGAPPSNERGSALGMTLTACTCPACQPREGPDDCTCSELEEGQTCEFCVEDEKYADAAYRLSAGPSIERWGWNGYSESLVGLKLELGFGHLGECRGTVTGTEEKWGETRLSVEWTSSPDHEEKFTSAMGADIVVGCHFRGRPIRSWMSDLIDITKRSFDCPLFSVPAGAQLTDFELPMEAQSFFPCCDGDPGERWWLTFQCLNDPSNADAMVRGTGITPYPTALLLAIMVLTHEELDPSTKLPLVKDPAKQAVYGLADQFCRRLAAASDRGRTGYGQLAALEKLAGSVAAAVPAAGTAAAAAAAEQNWRRAYTSLEALLLTLSTVFEQAHDSWHYADDPERLGDVCASIVLVAAAVLLHPPSVATKQQIVSDAAHLKRHLVAGSFVSLGPESDSFDELYPEAAQAWRWQQWPGQSGRVRCSGEKSWRRP